MTDKKTVNQQDKHELQREDRRYSVGVQRGKGRKKVRYLETNDPKKGCRFL